MYSCFGYTLYVQCPEVSTITMIKIAQPTHNKAHQHMQAHLQKKYLLPTFYFTAVRLNGILVLQEKLSCKRQPTP